MAYRIRIATIVAAFCLFGFACKEDGPKPVAADNTGKNKADQDPAAKTSGDQSESSSDVKITADIRRAVMKAENMSINAQNCKIITEKGVVTLRGPVGTQAERDSIGALAKRVSGVIRVENQLEAKSP